MGHKYRKVLCLSDFIGEFLSYTKNSKLEPVKCSFKEDILLLTDDMGVALLRYNRRKLNDSITEGQVQLELMRSGR